MPRRNASGPFPSCTPGFDCIALSNLEFHSSDAAIGRRPAVSDPVSEPAPASISDSAAEPAEERGWTQILKPERPLFSIPWGEIWSYRDLVWMLGRRDISAAYKQTVLGPLWFVLQPLMVTAVFSYLFGRMGRFGTDDIPHYLFYMSGIVLWNFFSETLTKASATFTTNSALFSKVYFPRLCVPVAGVVTNLVPLLVQYGLFLGGIAFYVAKERLFGIDGNFDLNWRVVFTPLIFLHIGALGLGLGLIVSALTRRFRDLAFGIRVGLQLWMFGSAVVFPLSRIADPADRLPFFLNPIVPIVESFRYAYFSVSLIEPWHIAASAAVTLIVLFIGIALFNRAEQTAMDTV